MTPRAVATGLLLVAGCTTSPRQSSQAPVLDPGIYQFRGYVTEVNQHLHGTRTVQIPVNGTIEVDERGYTIASSHGGCSGRRAAEVTRHRGEAVVCPEITISFPATAARQPTVRVLVREVQETRGSCAEWQTVNGRQQCVRYDTIYRERSTWRTAESVSVMRAG